MSKTAQSHSSEPPPVESSLKAAEKSWENHPANPYNWPEKKKWAIILIAAALTLLVGLNATATTTPSIVIAERFHVSDLKFPHSYWPVTVWNTAAAFGPMVGLPLLESFGIKEGYLVPNFLSASGFRKADLCTEGSVCCVHPHANTSC